MKGVKLVLPDREAEEKIRQVLRAYYDIQKLRLQMENRVREMDYVRCANNHLVPKPKRKRWGGLCPICGAPATTVRVKPLPILKATYKSLLEDEKALAKYAGEFVKNHAYWVMFLSRVKGVGSTLAAGLIVYLNPAKFETVSKMYKYAGLHVVDGKAPRRQRGKKIDWNPDARRLCWLLGRSFAYTGGVYKGWYRQFLVESLRNPRHRDWTMGHHRAHARRVVVKLFLGHYYEVVRRMLGLPMYYPYPVAQAPHRYIPPYIDYEGDVEKDPFFLSYVKPGLEDHKIPPRYYTAQLETLRRIAGIKSSQVSGEEELLAKIQVLVDNAKLPIQKD